VPRIYPADFRTVVQTLRSAAMSLLRANEGDVEETDAATPDEQKDRLHEAADGAAGVKPEKTDAESPEEQKEKISHAIDTVLSDLSKEAQELEAEEAQEQEEEAEGTGGEEDDSESEGDPDEPVEPIVDVSDVDEEDIDDVLDEDDEEAPWEEEHQDEAEAVEAAIAAAVAALSSGRNISGALALVEAAKSSTSKKPRKPSKPMTGAEKAARKRGQKMSLRKNRNKTKVYKSVTPFEKRRGKWRASAVFQWNNKGPKRTQQIMFPGDQPKPRAVVRSRSLFITQRLKDGGSFTYEYGNKQEALAEEQASHARKAKRAEIKKNVENDQEKTEAMSARLHTVKDHLLKKIEETGRMLNSKDIIRAILQDEGLKDVVKDLHPDTRRVLRRKYKKAVTNPTLSMEQRAISKGLLHLMEPMAKQDRAAARKQQRAANKEARVDQADQHGEEPPKEEKEPVVEERPWRKRMAEPIVETPETKKKDAV
jgi:hypothetical protein